MRHVAEVEMRLDFFKVFGINGLRLLGGSLWRTGTQVAVPDGIRPAREPHSRAKEQHAIPL